MMQVICYFHNKQPRQSDSACVGIYKPTQNVEVVYCENGRTVVRVMQKINAVTLAMHQHRVGADMIALYSPIMC